MWVNTIVLISPIRRASRPAANCDPAVSSPVQKKKAPAVARVRPNRWNSHSASSDCTRNPPPNESRLNSAAS